MTRLNLRSPFVSNKQQAHPWNTIACWGLTGARGNTGGDNANSNCTASYRHPRPDRWRLLHHQGVSVMAGQTVTMSERETGRLFAYSVAALFLAILMLQAV
jgi:hypothetical protein